MPTDRGQYAMTPGAAKAKADAAEAEEQDEKEVKGDLERVTIVPARNGFTVEVSYKPPKKKAGAKCDPCSSGWQPPVPSVFTSIEDALDFIKDELTDD
jgi:hypothetical protein